MKIHRTSAHPSFRVAPLAARTTLLASCVEYVSLSLGSSEMILIEFATSVPLGRSGGTKESRSTDYLCRSFYGRGEDPRRSVLHFPERILSGAFARFNGVQQRQRASRLSCDGKSARKKQHGWGPRIDLVVPIRFGSKTRNNELCGCAATTE